jgi:xylulokinase
MASTGSRDDLALVVDLGTTGLKVGLATLDGRLEAHRQATVTTTYGPHGAARQDAGAWWDSVASLATDLCALIDPSRIRAVAVTGQYASLVPVDPEGVPVGECVMWMDMTGGRAVRNAVGGPVSGYTPRAVWSFVRKTGGAPSPSGADGTGSLLSLLVEQPDVMARARWVVEPVDYLAMRFSGVAAATHASMVGSWLTDNRHLERMNYDSGLMKLLGISATQAQLLPPLVAFGSIVGEVTAAAARATGVPEGNPVIAGAPDLHAAALGAGTTSVGGPGHLALSTTSWVSAPVPKKKTDIRHSIASVPGLDTSSYLIADNHEIGAKALEWLAGALGVPAPIDFDALTREASSAAPGSGRVIFTPWLAGERSPVESHSARGGFHNLSLTTTRPDLVRAVMEGVAYNSRWLAEYVDRFAGHPLAPLRLLGGGATSDLWCQIHADVLGAPVDQVSEPMVAQLRGMGVLAGRSLGVIAAEEIDSLAKIGARFEPDAAAHAAHQALYAEFPGLLKVQAPMFRRLQRR